MSSNHSVPRRSARLAAKAAASTASIPTIPTIPTISAVPTINDPPRICYDYNCSDYDKWSTIVRQYLKDIETFRGKLGKSVLAICMMRFLSERPTYFAHYPRLHVVLQQKMEEFQQETVPDAVLNLDFHKQVENMLYLLQQV